MRGRRGSHGSGRPGEGQRLGDGVIPPGQAPDTPEGMTVFMIVNRPRILVLGLGDPARGDEGIGVYLARSLRDAFDGVEVRESSAEPPPFFGIFHDFDLLIVIDSVRFCSVVGRVYVGTPTSLSGLKGAPTPQTEALDDALTYARLTGARMPTIKVIGVCVPDEDTTDSDLTPAVAEEYAAILARVRAAVKEIIRDADACSRTFPAGHA